MNNKGFTLIELLVCITLIAVLSIGIGLNADKLFSNSNNSQKRQIMQDVFEAAAIYNNMNDDSCKIARNCLISDLIQSGLLEEKKSNPMYSTDNFANTGGDYVFFEIDDDSGLKNYTYVCANGTKLSEEALNDNNEWGKC